MCFVFPCSYILLLNDAESMMALLGLPLGDVRRARSIVQEVCSEVSA